MHGIPLEVPSKKTLSVLSVETCLVERRTDVLTRRVFSLEDHANIRLLTGVSNAKLCKVSTLKVK